MLRRASVLTPGTFGAVFATATTGSSNALQSRAYRMHEHLDEEVEELHATQKCKRWMPGYRDMQAIPTPNELECNGLNSREAKRTGAMPEKSIARTLSQVYTEDGTVCMPDPHYATKTINMTIIGLDGHPYYIRTVPTEPLSLNAMINFSGVAIGWLNFFSLCMNKNCYDWQHGDGCTVNVDVETLSKLLPPSRGEYYALTSYRYLDRGDVKFNTRFSCCIMITPELDGGLFSMKQYYSRALKDAALGSWGEVDNYAVISQHRCRRIEAWAPMLEEPTQQDFPFTYEMIWVESYEDIMKHKYPKYKRASGLTQRPRMWAHFT